MLSFRVIVVVDGERTIQAVVPFERAPDPGQVVPLGPVEAVVRHVIAVRRGDLAGIVLAWPR